MNIKRDKSPHFLEETEKRKINFIVVRKNEVVVEHPLETFRFFFYSRRCSLRLSLHLFFLFYSGLNAIS